MDRQSLIQEEQYGMRVDKVLLASIDNVEEMIVETVNSEVYFSVGNHDYSIAWVESEQCFGGKSGFRILQDGWGCVFSIHSTIPGTARCFYADGGDADYEIKHAPQELLRSFITNLPGIIETLQIFGNK